MRKILFLALAFGVGFYVALQLDEGTRMNLNKWMSELVKLPGRLLT